MNKMISYVKILKSSLCLNIISWTARFARRPKKFKIRNMNNKNIIQIISGIIVGILIGFFIFGGQSTTTNGIDKTKIEKIINNDLLRGAATAKVEKIKNLGSISEVSASIQGQPEQPLYVSNDGKVFYQKLLDLDELKKKEEEAKKAQNAKLAEIKKTDKPKVELFVMSYCPYGTQTEKGYLPAVEKLGDKIDAKVKFVNYVMHPSKGEGEENLLQYCIQKTQPEKFNSYLACFLKAGKTDECLAKNNISREALKTCLTETDKKFAVSKNLKDKNSWLNGRFPRFNVQDDLNKKYGVQGSPTLVINGQKVEGVGRDANSIFKAICSAFKNPPKVCEEELDKTAPAPGFGYDNSGANSSEGGCGA